MFSLCRAIWSGRPAHQKGLPPRLRPTFSRGGRREASCQWLRSQPWQAHRCFMVPRHSTAYLGGPVVGACCGLRWRANSASRCSVLRRPAGEACCPCPSSPAVVRPTVLHGAVCREGASVKPVAAFRCSQVGSALPNPSLERRPTEAGRLGRAAPVVYDAPRGHGGLPRRSPQLKR